MQVFVKCQRLHALTVEAAQTVSVLKSFLEKREGVSPESLNLRTRSGTSLQDNQLLSDVLVEGAHVDATVSVLGGKKLSIARAGKVRAQTPKVERIERNKKRKVGRAKKRQQYNRRFMNSKSGNGRSPNANQEYL